MGGRGTFAIGNPVPYVYNVDTTFSHDGKWACVNSCSQKSFRYGSSGIK